MFKISPVADKALINEYTDACGVHTKSNAFLYAMTDTDSGEIMGVAQFEITSEYGYIYDLMPKRGTQDDEAMFILGRQTMNFIDTCGVHICRADLSAADSSLMKKIGFKERDGYYLCDMTGMFDGHCSGHKVEL